MTAQARLLGGRYQVGELLGYGGMAEVHRGRDLRLGRDVAIKMLRTDLARDRTFQERFRREAQNSASLNHPAIVAVYDTGEEYAPTGETLPFIVMEFVNGRTLKEVLAAEGRLNPRRALEYCADICAALEFSHRHGIIHRDIKPGNVMLTQTGQVKVMDFGIARALASGATTMTQTSAVIGTAQYLSPEQARGESVDARSDVYAAGCVLFELLCGHPPFVGDSPVSVAYQHVREDPRAPSDINRDVTPAIDAIVLKALAKNPVNRYQSAGEMRADLLRAATGRPVLATPVLRQDETVAMGATSRTGSTQRIPAGASGGSSSRRTSPAVIAGLSVLGVMAVVALAAGLIYATTNEQEPPTVALPSLVGLPIEQARLEINNLRLVSEESTREEPDCTLNTVLDQSPEPGQVEPGSEVALTVCAGPGTVQVPSLDGFTRDAAERALADRDLVAEFEEVDSSAPKDQVVAVPAAGTAVEPGTVVEVHVSLNNLRDVPNVVGRTEADAVAALENAGFDVRVIDGDPVDPADSGRVTSQNPSRGEQRVNSRVEIVVSQAREPEASPSPTLTPTPSSTPTTPPPDPGDGDGEGGGTGGTGGGGTGSPLVPVPSLTGLLG
ncbi:MULTISPECIES: Stk1 family PASTA domain-containing Ser/Thr kinase [unclassified Solwaraspora]|uniref:Stk1 family PASTA domain-containing Ser/Thr kinase n=1 Tax=unclassified Solwaraspora TaxID=2627926 RepID=UPI00259B533C|nr:Stk1 family PASTA domain-containing Ser/Thr kinase [Solwaraspora sp. WMMA2056]WJK41661.1 Stk1 family PASTA domain-containing Ser/Thr kinase [Solwaraspora sp. WMMA2056]